MTHPFKPFTGETSLQPPFRRWDGKIFLEEPYRDGVIIIGNFDGVHRGHRLIIEEAARLRHVGQPLIALTFEPHPRTVFKPETPVFRLSPPTEKAQLLESAGMNGVINWPFSKEFSQVSADAFVSDILSNQIGASHVVVGYDFHFGKGRAGTPQFLVTKGGELGFGVTIIPELKDDAQQAYASSAIRHALAAADIERANELLGYNWFVIREVVHGEKRGRELGYPTANMRMEPGCQLAQGIYAVTVRRSDGFRLKGVASYGRRPQFDNGPPLLETFIFDFQGDLYGEMLVVEFHAFLRKEMKFDNVEALIAQMNRDSERAASILQQV